MRVVFAENYGDVVRFAQRRSSPDRAEDIAAQTFLVAWRRISDLPDDPGDARAWLFGVARNCLFNDRRTARRQDSLAVRLADPLTTTSITDPADTVVARQALARAWQLLTEADQEVLALSVFEQLTADQIGQVLEVSPGAVRVRLSRARARLRIHLESPDLSAHTQEVPR